VRTNPSSSFLLGAALVVCLLTAATWSTAEAQGDRVLAQIGNQTVTEADLDEMANAVPEKFRPLYTSPEGRKRTLDYVVNVYVLAAEAQNQGLDKTAKVQKLMEFTRKDLLARLYLDKMSKEVPAPTEQEAKEFYDKNSAQFSTPESLHLHHILVKTEKEAKDVLERLKKGEKFPDLASQVSICPSKSKGGNLDWLPRGSLLPEIEDVAFNMKNGQITGPVKSKFGYHVLFLEDRKPAQENPYDQVKDYIMEQLKFQRQQDYYEKLAEKLRKQMNVQVTADAVPTPAPPVPAGPAAPTGPAAAPPAGPK